METQNLSEIFSRLPQKMLDNKNNSATANSYKMQNSINSLSQELGECPPLTEKEFFDLMTLDKGRANKKMVALTLKYYPGLSRFVKSESSVSATKNSIDEMLCKNSPQETELTNHV